MKVLRLIGFLTLSCAPLFATGEKDQRVDLGDGLNGAFLQPAAGWTGKTVLFLHGFADDMDGAGDLTKHTAESLAAQGIASFRINFRGEGDRMRTDIESTFPGRLADAATAYRYLLTVPGVDKANIGVCGWSLGAATAIETCGEHPDWFCTCVLWSSPAGDPYAMFMASPVAQRAVRDGVAYDEVPGWKKIKTKREFYLSFKGFDLTKILANYHGPLLSIRGTQDFLAHADEELLKASGSPKAESVMLAGADHVFKVFDPKSSLPKRLIAITDAWLVDNL